MPVPAGGLERRAPSQQFYGTGVFHVAGLSGVHRVLDNRPTGTVRLCSTPDLSDCTTLTPGGYADYPFTSSTTLLVQP
ncbi:hypothetical protein VSR01_27175 [Actinacidiphila sp. DG2A-62]|uniref:hypothetical protein n=1 Tax=Actinacidiphila sp. DG2A-62 TaxID=3108821 RepID=UPI002DB6AA08|nr:hypothetical protein [Actinacidiphila sp. DG2A-62]MEC3996992.1 hypothetical protein [Actinacidiphila sp. DG2A-62]